MNMGAGDYLLWLTGFILNLGLLCVLLHKRRFQKLPWFTLLIAQDAVQTIVLFFVHKYPGVNFYTYWGFEAPSHFRLGFAAMTHRFSDALDRLGEFVKSWSAANMARA